MKKMKKSMMTMFVILSMTLLLAGCGNKTDMENTAEHPETTEQKGETKTTDDKTQTDMTGNAADDLGQMTEDAADDVGDAAKDIVDDAGEVVDDVADGVGDAIDNLGGGSFDSYDAAKNYLLEKLKKDNAGANYEVRDEKKELIAYNSNDSGAEGYQFSVYETDGNEKIGIYYVDKDTGKIYRYMGKNSIEAY